MKQKKGQLKGNWRPFSRVNPLFISDIEFFVNKNSNIVMECFFSTYLIFLRHPFPIQLIECFSCLSCCLQRGSEVWLLFHSLPARLNSPLTSPENRSKQKKKFKLWSTVKASVLQKQQSESLWLWNHNQINLLISCGLKIEEQDGRIRGNGFPNAVKIKLNSSLWTNLSHCMILRASLKIILC